MTPISIPECDVRPFDMGPLPARSGKPAAVAAGGCFLAAALAFAVTMAARDGGSRAERVATGVAAPVAMAMAEDVIRIDGALFSASRLSVPAQDRAGPAASTVAAPQVASAPLPPRRTADAAVAPVSAPGSLLSARVDGRGGLPEMFKTAPLPRAALGYAPQPTYAASAETPPVAAGHETADQAPGLFDRIVGAFRSLVAPTPDRAPVASGQDGHTAFYDISAHTVYMPDGSRLEAHSGLGPLFDDPRHVHARNRGSTPPHLYDLSLRERAFHGVQAIRLSPVGPGTVYGRDGLLAHTYMLGRRGDSNGCVSFKDYKPFLAAFRNGQVRRLAVVERMAG